MKFMYALFVIFAVLVSLSEAQFGYGGGRSGYGQGGYRGGYGQGAGGNYGRGGYGGNGGNRGRMYGYGR